MFVFRADVIPEIDRHHRQAAILVDDHAKAVLERMLRKWNVHEWGQTPFLRFTKLA
jgi:hypothetical protein